MSADLFIPYVPPRRSAEEMHSRARDFYQLMEERRSVRHFASAPVASELIELAIRTASTAPSGAHRQPWTFVAVNDVATKKEIRAAAEEEERHSYEGGRMPREWLEALAPLGTDWRKPYLEIAPWLVVVFEHVYGQNPEGDNTKNYYVKESVGIACGLFLVALHNMGLSTLTHTPSPMAFLTRICARPKNEKPFALFPVGYPADDAVVPSLRRKSLEEVAIWNPNAEHEP